MTQAPPTIEETLGKGFDPNISRRLAAYIRPYKWQFWFSLVLMLINSLAAVAGPFLVKVAVDSGMEAGSIIALRNAVLLYLVLVIMQWLAIYARVNIMARVGQSIIYDLRGQLFEHLQRLSLSFYSRFSVGRVITPRDQ